MAQALNLRPPPAAAAAAAAAALTTSRPFLCTPRPTVRPPSWNSLQLRLKCKPRVSALFSNNSKQDQARKALENALGEKKSDFEKWNKEIQKREKMGGGAGAGGGGWFGWRGWFGGGDHFWEEAQQASLVVLVLLFVYLVIAKGEALLAVVFNPTLFALRGVRNGFTYITSNIMKRISPDGANAVQNNTQPDELTSHMSAKEKVVRKWASD